MRGAIARREYLIETLQAQLEHSSAEQQQAIAAKRQYLAQRIASHNAQHVSERVGIRKGEREDHNHIANMLRGRVFGHSTRLALLNADGASLGDAAHQRLIRTEQGQLAQARRALAEHVSHSVQSERLLSDLRFKPDAQIAAMEKAYTENMRAQQHEITVQQQKLAEARRELNEHILDAVKQARLISTLQKEIATQTTKVEALTRQGKKDIETSRAQRELREMERDLKKLLDKSEDKKADNTSKTGASAKTISPKPKESKLDRLRSEAEQAKTEAENARDKATKAATDYAAKSKRADIEASELETAEFLATHLDKKATKLEAVAA
jgi:hypothetical protein